VTPVTLTPEQIERRVDIHWGVDAQECGICAKPLPDLVAYDPAWFMESVLVRDNDDDNDPTEYAIIRCPECW
jgi:hypothetical protein